MNNDLSFIHHELQVNSFEDLFSPSPPLPYHGSFDQAAEMNYEAQIGCKRSALQTDLHHHNPVLVENPKKQLKTNNWNSYQQMNNHVLNSQEYHDSNSTMLSFSNSSNSSTQTSTLITPKQETVVNQAVSVAKQSCIIESRPQLAAKKSASIPPQQSSMDHILAERKRREKLSQRFIALSAIIPGLKKMDKASVLGDAIKYVKQMQEKVKKLEEDAKKKTVESAVLVKRCYVPAEDNHHFSTADDPFPEMEVRFSDKDVLISIHCEKKKGLIEKVISQIEELHLNVISSSSLAFGGSALAVTITAQVINI
ncbi:hypothetical protein SOVF_137650 [Spinacia oleracea]|nr:hypothetical protein SOVF_137650 [Spinacia oleracea]